MSSSTVVTVIITTAVLLIAGIGLSTYYTANLYAQLNPEIDAVKSIFKLIASNALSGYLINMPIYLKYGYLKFEDSGIFSISLDGQQLFASKILTLTYVCRFNIYPEDEPVILVSCNSSGFSYVIVGIGNRIKLKFYPKFLFNDGQVVVACVVFDAMDIQFVGDSLELNYHICVVERYLAPLYNVGFLLRVVYGDSVSCFVVNASALSPVLVSVKVVKVRVEG